MKLRRIQLHGFKSFRDKTTIEIGDGITAVVGPNGCGKSNIVDGVRWAMGTQSARSLRGSEMRDVIFAGGGRFKPSGLAEVRLTFENVPERPPRAATSDRAPPGPGDMDGVSALRRVVSESATVEVGRRLYRSGDSVYLVNGVAVRLKDLQELFLGTGASVRGYSIIEQGQIEALVNARPAERRQFVEELAGVTRYRYHRAETERKLQAAAHNLDRVEDLIGEVKARMAQLKRQAQVARRFARLRRQRRRLEIHQLLAERAQSLAEASEMGRRLTELEMRRDAASQRLHEAEARMSGLEDRLTDGETELRDQTEELYRQRAKRDLLRQSITHAQSEREALAKERERVRQDVAELADERTRLAERLAQLAARLEEMPAPSPEEGADLEDAVAEAEALVASTARQLERSEVTLRRLEGEISEARVRGHQCRAEAERLARESETRGERRRTLEGEQQRELSQCDQLDAAVGELHQRESAALEAESGAADRVDDLRRQLEAARARLSPIDQRLARCSARHDAQSETLRAQIGGGARALLEAAEAGQLQGVRGTVGAGLDIPAGLEMAVQGVLRDVIEYVVVDSPEAAAAAIAFARRRGLMVGCVERRQVGDGDDRPTGGRSNRAAASTDRPEDRSRPLAPAASETSGASTTLDSVVPVAAWIPASVRALLASAALTGEGQPLGPADSAGAPIRVDRRGNCVSVDGFWRSSDPDGGPLVRQAQLRRELVALDAERAALARERTALADHTAALTGRLERAQATEREARSELETVRRAAREAVAARTEARSRLSRLEAQLEALRSSEGSDAQRQAELERNAGDAERAVTELQTRLSAKGETHDAIRARRAEWQQKRHAREHRLGAWRAEQERVREQRRGVEEQRDRVAARLQRGDDKASRLQERLAAIRERRDTLRLEIDANDTTAKSCDGSVGRLEGELADARQRLERLRGLYRSATERARELSEETIDLNASVERARAHLAGLQQGVASIESRLVNDFEVDVAAASEAVEGLVVPDDVPAKLAQLAGSIAQLGPINQAAAVELEESEARHRFLCEQQGDLVRSIGSMRATMAELDRASEAAFESTFQALQTEFETLFTRLFRGGSATLELTDPEDPLEAGVEVMVRPPGKRVRQMSLLSGGEKALAAVALVFAAFRLKPSPFCLLDEVDAPLDDPNVGRFIELIEELAGETQFLIVTHNRRTMEAADRLIGVTTEEPGCSTILEVQLRGSTAEPAESFQLVG